MASTEGAVFELGGLEFGHVRGPLRTFEWDPGVQVVRDQDVEQPHEDGLSVGRDRVRPPAWTLRLRTLAAGRDAVGAHEIVARFAAAWRPPEMLQPGVSVPLRYRVADRWRLVYGRPRRLTLPSTDVMVRQGRADILCDFQLTDPLHYSDALGSTSLAIVPPSVGGLQAPLAAPLSTVRSSAAAARTAVVGGDAPTPVRVVLAGPVTDPWVRVGGVLVGLRGSLAYDDVVTIDARTTTVLRADGASVAGMLAPRTRPLPELRLAPGEHEITFGGIDPTGTATAVVSWRDAWRSL